MTEDILEESLEEHNKDNEWLEALRSGKINPKKKRKKPPPKSKPRIVSSRQLRAIRG